MLIMALLHIPSPVPVSDTSSEHATECAGEEPSLRMPVPVFGARCLRNVSVPISSGSAGP